MITGIGIDSVDQDRITKIYSKFGQKFQDKILGPSEKEPGASKRTHAMRRIAVPAPIAKTAIISMENLIRHGRLQR